MESSWISFSVCQENICRQRHSHLEARLITPTTQANRILLSNQDSEFMSNIAPVEPNMAVLNKNCTKTLKRKNKDKTMSQQSKSNLLVLISVHVWSGDLIFYLISDNKAHTAGIGASSLLFDDIQHVDEQRAVHLVGQVHGGVTLRNKPGRNNKPKGE